jgi:hypothetical protein
MTGKYMKKSKVKENLWTNNLVHTRRELYFEPALKFFLSQYKLPPKFLVVE